ncbi:nuclear envelope pore membrane protein POM 121-like isoform X1 [Balaenoptera musculus]|uniref:Nuclear envelope pore membrane protein POM 121-like isoform X1 n=1 Tax=Balaenoptera musculus TaxID=9771 RepID=A0A8B8Y7F1_BALMU|nr:nuclear envelope pore membrane protein POM 121-like isoform X1 [Balaenoptera musculus]XP_036718228.1 nuclear envelope pore membrane protein POM 121-like isoform X1 [Balaenoptera musculus]
MGNLRCKCRTWCRRCQPRRGAPVGCHPLVLPSWEAATSDRNHPAAPTPAFCPSRRLSHRDRVPLLPGFHIALKTQYPIQQARYSRLGMLPLVSWRDSPKKPVLSAHNSIMVGHLRAIKSPPLGHKFTLLHSPAEQVVKVRKPIPSSHLPLPSPKEREVKVPSHAMVFSAPTACCSLLLERPTKEVLGEDHQPISPGSLMSGKELQREKSSHIPSRSSSSLLSTSSRPCKQKIPLPLFLPLPGLRSPPLGIEALTWDRGELPPPPKLPCLALANNPGTLEKNTEWQRNKILKNIRKVQPPSQEKEPPTPICVDSTTPLYLPTPLPIPTINPSILTGQPMTSMAIPSTSMVTASGSLTCSLLYILMSTWTLLPLPKLSFLGLPQVSGWSRGTLQGYQCPSPHLCRWPLHHPNF